MGITSCQQYDSPPPTPRTPKRAAKRHPCNPTPASRLNLIPINPPLVILGNRESITKQGSRIVLFIAPAGTAPGADCSALVDTSSANRRYQGNPFHVGRPMHEPVPHRKLSISALPYWLCLGVSLRDVPKEPLWSIPALKTRTFVITQMAVYNVMLISHTIRVE